MVYKDILILGVEHFSGCRSLHKYAERVFFNKRSQIENSAREMCNVASAAADDNDVGDMATTMMIRPINYQIQCGLQTG